MNGAHHLRVSTPQGDAGELTQEQGQFLFGYSAPNVVAHAASAISLTMPVRKTQYAHAALHPIFQMNLPEGFLLEELQNRMAKIVNLDPMLLLALSGGQAPIGRVAVQSSFVNPLANAQGRGERLSEILAWDGTESLFAELVNKYIYRTGISGVQPKVLVPQAVELELDSFGLEPPSTKATVRTADLIVKSGRQEYPGLAANEFLCMSIAKESGLEVPEFYLSRNQELFVMQRFDRTPEGTPIGFEDMAVLAGFSSREKYKTSYTHVAKLVEAFASGAHVTPSLHALFDMVALSCMVGNGDAHLKNFGLLYTDPTTSDCRLAPVFDVVNTTAYIPEDVLALDLCGQKSFFSARQGLLDFAKVCQVADPHDRLQRLILTAELVIEREAEVAQSIPHVVTAITHSINMLKEVFFV
jgi:serine/threonine-protein kinase HipA